VKSAYPHGALGAYPEPTGAIDGTTGGMAVDIVPTPRSTDPSSDGGWHVTLFDPCPTGALRLAGSPSPNPLGVLARRWDIAAATSRCSLSDESMVVHDFMSYGNYRWISAKDFFGYPKLRHVP
jgi:hypothetical protein